MPLPKFTDNENYLINSVKSPIARGPNTYMLTYVVFGACIAGFAAYYGSIAMMVTAFVVVCGFRIYEEWYQKKWEPLWCSIIDKYEAACVRESQDEPDDFDADQ